MLGMILRWNVDDVGNAFSKEMLETEKCYMLDCDGEIFVWMGRQTFLTERRTAIRAVEVKTLFFKFPFVS